MRTHTTAPRGMALVMAMIVVVLITLLVAGAISFTGTERAAAEIQTQEDTMSSCVLAARNLFLSRMRPVSAESIEFIQINENITDTMAITTAHFTGTATQLDGGINIVSVDNLNKGAGADRGTINSIDNTPGNPSFTHTYRVTALCRDSDDPNQIGTEREVEFLVKVGL